jgi:RNA recognition motif-containing protein
MNLYVANISAEVDAQALRLLFSRFGEVAFVRMMIDRDTGSNRGFAFVDMPDDREAMEAIRNVANSTYFGKKLLVSKAKPKV